jgi:nickel-dependent lactate racemase
MRNREQRFLQTALFSQFSAMPVLRYGIDSSVSLELANGLLPQQCGTPHGRPMEDLQAAVAWALLEPLDYPPLVQCTTPGDRVVLALGRGIPQVAQVTAAVIRALVEGGVDSDGITVLRAPGDTNGGAAALRSQLDETIANRITLTTHHPDDRQSLAYLAASESGEPILIHRALHEADVVLPIGCLHVDAAAGYFGIHGSVYPLYSDEKTLARFRAPAAIEARSNHRRHLIEEADHVAWLLGVNFTIQVVPAGGDRIMHVVAGESEAVRRRGRELYRAAWSGPVGHRASLVVAAIEGGPGQQTWENLGRALSAALPLADDGGAIAVCCDLDAAPGPAVQQLASRHSRASVLRRIEKERPRDALPAAELARALEHGPVYLLSRLAPSLVEDLDVAPIANADELARLARQHQTCTLLSNAAQAVVSVQEEV